MKDFITIESEPAYREMIESWIHRWGNSASEVAFEPLTLIFRAPNIDGFICYRIESGSAVAFGDPVCAHEDTVPLAQAFHSHCQEKNLNMVFIIASEPFANWAITHLCSVLIEMGEEIIFDPQNDSIDNHQSDKLRNYIHHANKVGLKVHEYLLNDKKLEHSIDQVGVAWLKARRGPQIYLGTLNFFDDRSGKRWFYVQRNEQIIAVALLTEIKAHRGWVLKFLISVPDAPRGTSELLVVSILNTLRRENCHYLTCGIIPLEGLGKMIGLSRSSEWLARIAFQITKWIFHLNHRKIYWHKFHPKTERSYILSSSPNLGLKEIQSVLKALNIK